MKHPLKWFALVVSIVVLALQVSSRKTEAARVVQVPAGTKVYSISNIPPQVVRHGATLQFQVKADESAAATFAFTLDPDYPVVPLGALSLNAASGLFSYKPAAADKFEFSVKFAGSVNGVPAVTQTVVITPLADLPPESDLLAATRPTPDPESVDYQLVTQSLGKTKEMHNGVEQPLRDVQISGKRIVFATGNPLYERFNGARDLKSVTITAETVVIRSPLMLPGTNVTIYARELRFEDTAGKASLDTTPKDYSTGASQFSAGLQGQKGGDIVLRIQSFFSNPGVPVRLIASGGKGQNPGQGRAGSPKPALTPSWTIRTVNDNRMGNALTWNFHHQGWGWVLRQDGNPLRPPYPTVLFVGCTPCGQYQAGQKVWPQNGEDAVPPGTPGTGGAGGNISSSLQIVSTYAQMVGGVSGQAGTAQRGGPPQEPTYSAWLQTIDGRRCNDDYFNFQVTEVHTSIAGKDAPSVSAAQPQGRNGSFVISSAATPTTWLHPNFLRLVIAHAKDAYIGGNFDYAKLVFGDYLDFVNNYGVAPDENTALQIAQAKAELEGYLQKLNSNLDYFGNPANWVPLLSLEATMRNFTNEVDSAMLILYLQYWLENKAANNQKDVQALRDSISKLDQDTTQVADAINSALESVPNLQFQSAELGVKLQMLQAALERKEAELEQRARNSVAARKKLPFWKRAVRIIATIAKLVPVYQPALGAIGTGLDLLTRINPDDPLSTIAQLGDVVSTYNGSGFKGASDSLKSFLKADLTRRTNEKAFDYAKRLSEEGKKLAPAVKLISQEFKTKQIDNAEVQRELEKIKATDPEFNDLIQQLTEVNAQKEAFTRALADTMQKISSGTTQVSENLLTVGVMYRQLDPAIAGFDHSTLLFVREMGREAQERLLRYQYSMAKAYEYRMLKPYPGDYKLNQVTSRLVAMLGNNYTLNPADFAAIKAVYVASVREIVAEGLNELQKQPPERSLPFFFELLPEELRQLNQAGAVSIDLTPRIAGLPNEENRHIADLGVADNGMQVQVNGPGPVSGFGRVRVVPEHNGQSLESASGHSYRFTLGAGPGNRPFSWGASHDVLTGRLDRETLSIAGLSLLQSLLGITAPVDSSSLALFARPGADATIRLLKYQDPTDMNAAITRLRLFVAVDFYRTASTQVWLNVQTPNETTPYVVVNQTDLAGRADGRGTFRRAYRQGAAVKLTAEPDYGSLRFQHWADQTGAVLSNTSALNVTLDASRTVRAVYQTQAVQTPPTINGRTLTLQQGSSPAAQTIATVSAAQDAQGSLAVTVTSAPSGITVDSLANNNGTITAKVTATCTAAAANNIGLKVTDSNGQTATATLTVNVTPNTPPKLGTYNATTVGSSSEVVVTPSAAPEDNGSVSSLTATVTPSSFTGTVAVNPTTGVVTINNAGPVGNYNVTLKATDNCEATTTASFALTVNQQTTARVIRVAAASGASGGTVSVPIEIIAQGTENAIGFSLNFDPAVLGNPQVSAGSGIVGTTPIYNLNQVAQGKIGITIALPAGQSLAAGTRQLAIVIFTIAASANASSTPLNFGDQPVTREVADSSANTLPATYSNGTVTFNTGFEADVAPRPNGNNGTLTVTDQVQVCRFAAGLDTAALGSEFQRADCAPRNTLGNGVLTISDCVQAGRYAAGLDPVTAVGGPAALVTALAQFTGDEQRREFAGRSTAASVVRAQLNSSQDTLTLMLDTSGGANGLGLSLMFNPAEWRYVSAALDNDAAEATLILNTKQTVEGHLGLALALPAGRTFSAGERQLFRVTFAPVLNAGGQAQALAVGFADTPVAREVAAVDASVLEASYSIESVGQQVDWLATVPAASYRLSDVASEQIVAAFGKNLATETLAAATVPLPTELAGTRVVVKDSTGTERLAPLFFVSPTQVNYQVPAGTKGVSTVNISNGKGAWSLGLLNVVAAAPGLFTANANGLGVPAAAALRVSGGTQTFEPVARYDAAAGQFIAAPLELGLADDQVILLLFGSGIRGRSDLTAVTCQIGGVSVPVSFAGAQGDLVGLDQINIGPLPRALAGRGEVDLVLLVDGKAANTVRVSIK